MKWLGWLDEATDPGVSDAIDRLMAQQREDYERMLEEACETALATGTCGVLVTHASGYRSQIIVTNAVPYGEIHERRI